MPAQKTVAVLIGSLRKESVSRKTAKALAALTPDLNFNFLEIGNLPFFNQDIETSPPAEWVAFRNQIKAADAVLCVAAEYTRSIPGVLKNAIASAPRPSAQGPVSGNPAAVIS